MEDPENQATAFPVRYHNGQIQMDVKDIELPAGAVSVSHKRKYDNLKYNVSGLNGFGWKANELPNASLAQDAFMVEFSANRRIHFDIKPDAQGIHHARGNDSDTLQINFLTQTLAVTRKNGVVWTFSNDPKGLVPLGLPLSAVAGNGKVTEFVYQDHRLVKVVAKDQSAQTLAELEYTHNPEGLLTAVTLRQHDSNVLKPVKRVLYSYYTDEDSCGNAGDLKAVTTEMAINDSWSPAGTYCYRYYKGGESSGQQHAMKMAFFPADGEFAQKSGVDCCQVPDSEALEYATKYYEYDGNNRVILERVDRNRKRVTMEYTEYPDTDDLNTVHRKTVETGPFGNRNIVFTNCRGKVLLREEVAPSGTEEPSAIYHFRYNGNGKRTHKYSGGVVLGYTVVPGTPTTLQLDLSPNKGKIEVDRYYDYHQNGSQIACRRRIIQNGTDGLPIALEEKQRECVHVNGNTNWKTKQEIQFVDEDAKSVVITSYWHELFPGTDKVMQRTTILPVVPKEQNGTGVAATIVERFDEKGRLLWWKDELGIIGYSQYDSDGRQVKTIQDVDTARTDDFTATVPQGWATVADADNNAASKAGRHLVTEYEYDVRGRMTQVLYPENESVDDNNNVITARKAHWTVYDDARRRTMSASGYVTAFGQTILVNPVSITIRGVGGKVLEEIQAARDNAEGRLLATDSFPQSSYVSWTKHQYEGRNRTATRVYTTIPTRGDGVQGKNYDETAFLRDEFGRQDRTIAPNGLITKQKRNWHGHAVEVWQGSDEANLVLMTEMVYGGEGECHTCSGRGGNPRVVVQHVDAEKTRITENVYDWRGRLIETFGEEDANGQFISTKNFYDNLGRAIKTEQFVNDAIESRLVARSESFTTPQGSVWCQTQSAADPAATNSGAGELVETKKSQVWFDAKGRSIKSFSACQCLTNVTTYDSLGRTVKSAVLGKDGKALQETEQVYDNAGHVIQTVMTELSATGKKNFVRKQFSAQWFDPMGRSVASAQFGTNGGKAFVRTKTVPTTGLVTRRIYDSETGLDTAHIDAAGRTTVFTYDATRRRVKESLFKPDGTGRKLVRETRSQVDTRRGISTQTDALGNTTQAISDIFGRTIAQIDAMGNRAEMVYNRGGELLEQRDPMGRVTRFVYDALGRREAVILPKPSPTEKSPVRKTVYNALGQVIQEIDPLGNATTTEYDAFGRRAAVIDAESGRTEFTYDATGKMLSLKDPVGNVTSYVYDDLGRMLEETNELGKTRRFEYEGRLPVRKTDRNGRVTMFEYNDFGKPISEKWLNASGKVERTITSQYDSLGKLEQVADLDSTHTFEYDDLDRGVKTIMQLTGLEMPITFGHQFDEANRRTQVAAMVGNAVDHVNQYFYDALGRVTGISQNEKRVEYAYNAGGQRTATSVFAGAGKVFDTLYGYDGMGRLTDLTHSNGDKVFAAYDYTWDSANRITGFDFTYLGAKDEKTAEYGYDLTSQLVAADYNAFQPNEAYEYDANGNRKNFVTGANNLLTSDGVFCYTYDNEGNRVEKMSISTGEKTQYVWDHRNRLTQVITPKESVLYSYDYLNRMTRRNSEFVVHDGWQIVLTLDAKGNVKDRNFWGANQDELIATNDQFALCDHLGSVRDVVDAGGKVVEHREYNAFGKVVRQTGKSGSVFGYTGKMFDDATGLQWNINRWYDANVGRWISEDPIGFLGKDVSLYRYVGNIPMTSIDTNGQYPITCICSYWGWTKTTTVPHSWCKQFSNDFVACCTEGCRRKCWSYRSYEIWPPDDAQHGAGYNPRDFRCSKDQTDQESGQTYSGLSDINGDNIPTSLVNELCVFCNGGPEPAAACKACCKNTMPNLKSKPGTKAMNDCNLACETAWNA